MASSAFVPLRSLGERQLQIQFTLLSMYDTQAMGILALNGALLAAAIAAKDLLGHLWWLALVGLLISSLPCIVALSRGGGKFGLEIKGSFCDAKTVDAGVIEELVARSVGDAVADNDHHLRAKRRLILLAITLLSTTIGLAILVVLAF